MALFKILKGTVTNFNKVDANGNPNVPIREGYCYVTTDEKHMYIDISSDERICLEAEWADHAHMLGNSVMGSPTSPIYLSTDGIPAQCERLLPLSAGVNNKLTGALGLPKTTMYGPTLPSSGFDGQLFFLEDSGAALPTGGSSGQALVKNSSTDGDASWKSSAISWTAGTTAGPKPNIFGVTGTAIPAASGSASGVVTTGAQTFAGQKTFSTGITLSAGKQIQRTGQSMSWVNGRDGAIVRMTTCSGYSPTISCKTPSGSWEIGTYDNSSYAERLVFSYTSDANYSSGTNTSNRFRNAL